MIKNINTFWKFGQRKCEVFKNKYNNGITAISIKINIGVI